MWKVRVETVDGELKEFEALDTYTLTPEQKLLWNTLVGEPERITNMRIKVIVEKKILKEKDEQNSHS